MAKKIGEKISTRSLDKILDNQSGKVGIEDRGDYQAIVYQVEDGKTLEVRVKKILSIAEADNFVEAVGNGAMLVDESGVTRFSPTMADYAYYLSIVVFFTNLKPDIGADRIYRMVYSADMMDCIESCINQRQLNDLKRNVHELSEFNMQVGVNYHASKTQALIEKIDTMTTAISTMAHSVGQVPPEKLKAAIEEMADLNEGKIIHLMKEGYNDNEPSEGSGASDQ